MRPTARPSSPAWRRKKRVSLKQLGLQPIILREAGSGSRWVLEQALAQSGKSLAEWRIAAELGSNEAIKEAVLRGLGVAILSTWAVQKEQRHGRFHTLRIVDLPLERPLYLVWDHFAPDTVPSSGTLMLVGFFVTLFGGLPIGFALALAALTFIWV